MSTTGHTSWYQQIKSQAYEGQYQVECQVFHPKSKSDLFVWVFGLKSKSSLMFLRGNTKSSLKSIVQNKCQGYVFKSKLSLKSRF